MTPVMTIACITVLTVLLFLNLPMPHERPSPPAAALPISALGSTDFSLWGSNA